MNRQPYVAGAAIVAGLIVGGGAYTARHGIGQPPVDSAAASPSSVAGQIPRVPHVRLAEWHPPKIPKVTVVRAVAPVATSAPAPVAVVSSPAPVTRTSPVASGDDGQEAGDD